MIQSFKCKDTQALFEGVHPGRFRAIQGMAERKSAQYFGGDAVSWLVMQANHDLKTLPSRAEIEQRVPHCPLALT